MRCEESIPENGKETLTGGFAIEGLTQNPQGRWYPTMVRRFKCVNPMAGERAAHARQLTGFGLLRAGVALRGGVARSGCLDRRNNKNSTR